MKLLIIICIEEFEDRIKAILNHSAVKSFTYQSVKGYKNNGLDRPWFVSETIGTDSLMFTVFIENDFVDDIFKRVKEFNELGESYSKIHLSCLEIEHSL